MPTRGYEVLLPGSKLILLDCAVEDQEMELAHALAHLDLHLDSIEAGAGFSDDEEAQADWLAALRLDRPGTWQWN